MRFRAVVLLVLSAVVSARASAAPSDCSTPVHGGARLDCPLVARTLRTPTVLQLRLSPTTFIGEHATRVWRDMIWFRGLDVEAHAAAENVDRSRAQERLLLLNRERGSDRSPAMGAGLFAGAVLVAAHVPAPLRVLVDGRLHFGPSVFDGGLGAGLGGSF